VWFKTCQCLYKSRKNRFIRIVIADCNHVPYMWVSVRRKVEKSLNSLFLRSEASLCKSFLPDEVLVRIVGFSGVANSSRRDLARALVPED